MVRTGGGGAASQEPSLSGGQPKAASQGTRVINLVINPPPHTLSYPGSHLPSWETDQKRANKPEDMGLEVSLGLQQGTERWNVPASSSIQPFTVQ